MGQQDGDLVRPVSDLMRRLFSNPITRPTAIAFAQSRLALMQDRADPYKRLQFEQAVLQVKKLERELAGGGQGNPTDDQRELAQINREREAAGLPPMRLDEWLGRSKDGGGSKFDDVSGLRKEVQSLPSYKNLAQAAPIYKAMAETAGRDTRASDLNLVYGLGKIMDPTSVVREGEMVMVKNTASLPDWLQGAIASINGGAALTPETRKAIMAEAYGRVKGYQDAFEQDAEQYRGIVDRYQINPQDVLPNMGALAPWEAPQRASELPPGVTEEDIAHTMRLHGLTREQVLEQLNAP